MTLYRKYRPQKLGELDNKSIQERLVRISSSYIPHALLFTGSKGTGKTSAARIVAKVLNCEKRNSGSDLKRVKGLTLTDTTEPCNKCETCAAITEGRHLDIIEIDAASNRGIEEIRDLREKIKLAPVSAKFKVYIIDEVHMLTHEAFNALLKTLEEPPSHAVFILATTEPEKLPATIVSRCIKFNFQKAKVEEVIHCLERVVKGEKVSIDDEILKMIAQVSDGSFRDATKLLEQAILEDALEKDKLNRLLGRQNWSAADFLKILSQGNLKEVLVEITRLAENGVNFRYLVEEVLNLLHALLLASHGIESDKVEDDLQKLYTKTEVSNLIKLFSKVYIDLRNTSIPQLPLEVAVVEWCESNIKIKK